jgi:amino-acid N-acetyltransferase
MMDDMMLPVTFSGVRPGEASLVSGLIADAGLPVQDLNPQKLVHFIVARRGDAIVGTVGLEPVGGDRALLRSLTVMEGCRSQAIATRLVIAVEKYARSHGIAAVYLLTTSAAGFFVKQGYRIIDRKTPPDAVQATEEFSRICPATAVCLTKSL